MTLEDKEAIAQQIVAALFKDLRDRRFLKWLFDERGDEAFIARFDDGERLMGLALDVQDEIKNDWKRLIVRITQVTNPHDDDVEKASDKYIKETPSTCWTEQGYVYTEANVEAAFKAGAAQQAEKDKAEIAKREEQFKSLGITIRSLNEDLKALIAERSGLQWKLDLAREALKRIGARGDMTAQKALEEIE